MTLEQAVIEAWEMCGAPSDMSPYTAGAYDQAKASTILWTNALNDAQDLVATWIGSGGRRLHFHALEDIITFEPKEVTGTFDAGLSSPWKTLALPASLGSEANRFAEWVLEVGAETRRVLRHYISGGVDYIVLNRPLTTDPSSTAFTLYQRIFTFGSTGTDTVIYTDRLMEILRVIDLSNDSELEMAPSGDMLTARSSTVGIPGMWARSSRRLVLDCAVDDERSYELAVKRYPRQTSLASDSFELPANFHPAIVLKGIQWGQRLYEEYNAAYATGRTFDDLMSRLQTELDALDATQQDYFRIQGR